MMMSLQRIHLLEKKDIRNIALAFNLDDVKRHKDDLNSVRSLINEWIIEDSNPVLYYKLQGKRFRTKNHFLEVMITFF